MLDGESVALTGRWRYRRGGWRFGIDLPLVYQSGGVLDGPIDAYHDLFGFPEGSRPQLPKDELRYLYEREGERLLDVRGHGSGLGEVTVQAGRVVASSARTRLAWRAHLKVPTGDTGRLLGSGTAGLGASLHAETARSWRGRALHWVGGSR